MGCTHYISSELFVSITFQEVSMLLAIVRPPSVTSLTFCRSPGLYIRLVFIEYTYFYIIRSLSCCCCSALSPILPQHIQICLSSGCSSLSPLITVWVHCPPLDLVPESAYPTILGYYMVPAIWKGVIPEVKHSSLSCKSHLKLLVFLISWSFCFFSALWKKLTLQSFFYKLFPFTLDNFISSGLC